MEALIYYTSLF